MDVDVSIRDLKAALTIGKRVIGGKGTLPALSGVRLTAIGGHLGLVTSNLDVTVLQTIGADVHVPGQVLAPAHLLADTVKSGGKGTIALRLTDDGISVVNGATTQLRTLPLEEFLCLPLADDGPSYPLNMADVAEVLTAASKDDARPILSGVLFHEGTLCATDSYRLHVVRGDTAYPLVNVPASALAQVIAAKPKGPVTMQVGSTHVHITAGSTVWAVRHIEGEFPNYRQLIPNPGSYPYTVEVNRAGLISLVTAIKPMAREATPVRLRFEATTLTVTALTHDVGNATGSMACVTQSYFPDEGVTVAFNPEFLLDACKTARGTTVTITFIDALKPALITDERGSDVSTHLLMPVRVS